MKLFDLINLQHKIENAIIENGGELPPDLEKEFELSGDGLREKIDAYAWTMDRCEALSEEFKKRANQFYEASKQFSNLQNNLKKRLKAASDKLGPDLVGNDYRFKISDSKAKLIIDVATQNLDPHYTIAETIISPNTDAIRLALLNGIEIDGCKLEKSFSIRKFLNKKELKK